MTGGTFLWSRFPPGFRFSRKQGNKWTMSGCLAFSFLFTVANLTSCMTKALKKSAFSPESYMTQLKNYPDNKFAKKRVFPPQSINHSSKRNVWIIYHWPIRIRLFSWLKRNYLFRSSEVEHENDYRGWWIDGNSSICGRRQMNFLLFFILAMKEKNC